MEVGIYLRSATASPLRGGSEIQSLVRWKGLRVQRPKFTLNQICPVCEQGSSLVFLTCPQCAKLILACDEEGTVFPNPCDLSLQAAWPCDVWQSTVTKCPHCLDVGEFAFATGDQIQAAGVRQDEYH